MDQQICLVENCTRAPKTATNGSHGKYCSMHYERRRRLGSFGSGLSLRQQKPYPDANGYLYQPLAKGRMALHRLRYMQSFGPIPKGYVVHHKDGNILNNHPMNLEALTRSAHVKLHAVQNKV